MELIDTENKVLNLLLKLQSGESICEKELDFSELKKVSVKIEGPHYNGEISSSLCYSLANFHENLCRLYCLIKYGEESLARLKDKEKESLEVVFNVSKGCTAWDIDLENIVSILAHELAKGALEKMTGNQIMICVITIIIAYTGFKLYDRHLQTKDRENDKKSTNDALTIQSDAMNKLASTLIPAAEEMFIEHLKTYDDPERITIRTGKSINELNKQRIYELTRRNRRETQNVEDAKKLKIESIKKLEGKYTANCCILNDKDHTFPVTIDTSLLRMDEIDLIFEALKNDTPVFIVAEYKLCGGSIKSASASEIYI